MDNYSKLELQLNNQSDIFYKKYCKYKKNI